jgi:hypothetical protein
MLKVELLSLVDVIFAEPGAAVFHGRRLAALPHLGLVAGDVVVDHNMFAVVHSTSQSSAIEWPLPQRAQPVGSGQPACRQRYPEHGVMTWPA